MSAVIEEVVVEDPEDVDDPYVPIGHVASLEWLLSDQTTRPTRAMCGAEILGIPADVDHVKCEACVEAIYALDEETWERIRPR